MAVGEYVSNKSEADFYSHEIEQERLEIELCSHIEKEELRLIYRRKGFEGQLFQDISDLTITDRRYSARKNLGKTRQTQRAAVSHSRYHISPTRQTKPACISFRGCILSCLHAG